MLRELEANGISDVSMLKDLLNTARQSRASLISSEIAMGDIDGTLRVHVRTATSTPTEHLTHANHTNHIPPARMLRSQHISKCLQPHTLLEYVYRRRAARRFYDHGNVSMTICRNLSSATMPIFVQASSGTSYHLLKRLLRDLEQCVVCSEDAFCHREYHMRA